MTDIVEELRQGSLNKDDYRWKAADEIERLREWKEIAYQMRNKYWWVISKKLLEQFDTMHEADWQLPRNVQLRKYLEMIDERHD